MNVFLRCILRVRVTRIVSTVHRLFGNPGIDDVPTIWGKTEDGIRVSVDITRRGSETRILDFTWEVGGHKDHIWIPFEKETGRILETDGSPTTSLQLAGLQTLYSNELTDPTFEAYRRLISILKRIKSWHLSN